MGCSLDDKKDEKITKLFVKIVKESNCKTKIGQIKVGKFLTQQSNHDWKVIMLRFIQHKIKENQ